ncbi:bifunctional chorismate mutase/prephenate dehydrogenase [Candidatus Curculioniphilus buchneri]|uniref:bifunctional chorismate mutase/prephenate dehydrogenase n=1 Tax=Candidatus Curculioniphilus buchneri TaxID=690594 RepID=UPI00376EFB5A
MIKLDILRKEIDKIDKMLLNLLSKRLALVNKVGKIKIQHGLPIYDHDREMTMLTSRRQEASTLGISPDLIEDILRRVMRESYITENNKGFKTLFPELRQIVIIGGRGQMGRLFNKMLILSGYQVHILGREDWLYSNSLLSNAGMVIISVPLHLTISIIQKLPPLPEDCILVDLASIKHATLQAMLSVHNGPVLGLHPMFGPDVDSIAKQVIIFCEGRKPEAYQWLLKQMQLWGAHLYHSNTLEHDHNMSFIQALRYFITFTYGMFLAKENVNIKKLLALASPSYRIDLIMIGRFFSNNPKLYANIIFASEDNILLIKLYHQYVGMALNLLEQGNSQTFTAQFEDIALWLGNYTKIFLKKSKILLHQVDDCCE